MKPLTQLLVHPLTQLLNHLRRSRQPIGTTPGMASRTEICPPALGRGSSGGASAIGLRAWLGAAWFDSTIAAPKRRQRRPQEGGTPLNAVRLEFNAALNGLTDGSGPGSGSSQGLDPTQTLRESLRKARSMRELWHLRAAVYALVARHGGEAEAQRRLQALNRHFATRAARADRALF